MLGICLGVRGRSWKVDKILAGAIDMEVLISTNHDTQAYPPPARDFEVEM